MRIHKFTVSEETIANWRANRVTEGRILDYIDCSYAETLTQQEKAEYLAMKSSWENFRHLHDELPLYRDLPDPFRSRFNRLQELVRDDNVSREVLHLILLGIIADIAIEGVEYECLNPFHEEDGPECPCTKK